MTSEGQDTEYERRYRTAYDLGARTWRQTGVDTELQRFLIGERLAPGKAIDLGCGEGIDAIWLAQQGWQVVGIDLSPTAIERARELAAEAAVAVGFEVGNVLDLSCFARSSFDLAVSIFTLHMFVEVEHRALFLNGAYDVLRPGGWLFLDNLARLRGVTSQALPPGQLAEYDVQVDRKITRIQLPAIASVRLSSREMTKEVTRAGFLVRQVRRAGPADYRRVILWARKPG